MLPASSTPALPAVCSICRLPHHQPFSDLDPLALADYNAIGSIRTFPSTEMLFREQVSADRVVILYRGHAKLSCASKDGRSMTLRVAGPGHVLGLSAVLSAGSFEVSAQVLDAVTAKTVRRAAFVDFLERRPEASLLVARALADEYKTALNDVRRFGLSTSVPSRVASLLMDWRTAPLQGHPEIRFQMAQTHDEIASFVATSRESVTRILTKFRQDKYIHIQGVWVHILEPEKLARIAV